MISRTTASEKKKGLHAGLVIHLTGAVIAPGNIIKASSHAEVDWRGWMEGKKTRKARRRREEEARASGSGRSSLGFSGSLFIFCALARPPRRSFIRSRHDISRLVSRPFFSHLASRRANLVRSLSPPSGLFLPLFRFSPLLAPRELGSLSSLTLFFFFFFLSRRFGDTKLGHGER